MFRRENDSPQVLVLGAIYLGLTFILTGCEISAGKFHAELRAPASTPDPISAVCGAAQGGITAAAPTTQLCATGSPSPVSGSGPWSWNCLGSNGGAATLCTAYRSQDGICGSSHLLNFQTPPTTQLCQAGTTTPVTINNGFYTWSCRSSTGGAAASCTAGIISDALCGSSNGATFLFAPSTNLCTRGSASVVTGSGPWNWNCASTNGGSSASCSANRMINGSCGSSNGQIFLTAPTANLCTSGSTSSLSGTGPWNWLCSGLNGGTTASCTALKTSDGVCGVSNLQNFNSVPTTNLCANGNASSVTGSGPWNWTCAGYNGGITVTCSANRVNNGTCGAAQGQYFSAAPTTHLCNGGSASVISGTGPWSWTCYGVNGGSNSSCSAQLSINGVCGTNNLLNLRSAPTTNLCSQGNPTSVTPTGNFYYWDCISQTGGSTANCHASKMSDGLCGPSNGQNLSATPTLLCDVGSPSAVTGTGPWSWNCTGINGGNTASCFANRTYNGVCGAAHNATFPAAPTQNLCAAGSATSVSGTSTGPWSWSCNGSYGGTNASCSAQYSPYSSEITITFDTNLKASVSPPSAKLLAGSTVKIIIEAGTESYDSLGIYPDHVWDTTYDRWNGIINATQYIPALGACTYGNTCTGRKEITWQIPSSWMGGIHHISMDMHPKSGTPYRQTASVVVTLESSAVIMEPGTCAPVRTSGGTPDRKFNVIFVASDFDSATLSGFPAFVDNIVNQGFGMIEPIRSNLNRMNIYRVDRTGALDEPGRDGVHNTALWKRLLTDCVPKANINLYITVSPFEDGLGDMASTSEKIVWMRYRLNDSENRAKTAVHEFGHAVGNLGDEYMNINTIFSPGFENYSRPNIDVEGCPKWCSGTMNPSATVVMPWGTVFDCNAALNRLKTCLTSKGLSMNVGAFSSDVAACVDVAQNVNGAYFNLDSCNFGTGCQTGTGCYWNARAVNAYRSSENSVMRDQMNYFQFNLLSANALIQVLSSFQLN